MHKWHYEPMPVKEPFWLIQWVVWPLYLHSSGWFTELQTVSVISHKFVIFLLNMMASHTTMKLFIRFLNIFMLYLVLLLSYALYLLDCSTSLMASRCLRKFLGAKHYLWDAGFNYMKHTKNWTNNANLEALSKTLVGRFEQMHSVSACFKGLLHWKSNASNTF